MAATPALVLPSIYYFPILFLIRTVIGASMAGIIIPVRTRVAITLPIAVVLAVTVAIPRPIPVAISIAIPTTVSLPILVPFTVTLTLAITRRLARMLLGRLFFNPLSPNSDQHQFSLNNIHTMSRDEVMRLNKMIT